MFMVDAGNLDSDAKNIDTGARNCDEGIVVKRWWISTPRRLR